MSAAARMGTRARTLRATAVGYGCGLILPDVFGPAHPGAGRATPIYSLCKPRKGTIMTITRHKLIATYSGGAACDCGYDPRIVLEQDFDWTDAAREVLAHIKKSRRWEYQGTEVHAGFTYHLWQNELTGRKYAWEAETYRAQLTAAVRWTA